MHNLLSHFVAAVLLVLALPLQAAPRHIPFTHPGPLLPDSSNFVTASLVLFSPGDNVYSSLGHCAVRMECPVHDLDFCFSLETDVQMADYIKFFSGRANAAFSAVPTDEFMRYYIDKGRGAVQYELNLTPQQKQELWRILDEDMVAGVHRKFNFIENNCSSSSLLILEQSILPERIHFRWPQKMQTLNNGDGIRYLTRNAPLTQFLCMALIGNVADDFWPQENRMSPELYPETVKNAALLDDEGHSRSLLKDVRIILPMKQPAKSSPFTPAMVLGVLLALVVLITLLQWWRGAIWNRVGHWLDVALFALQTLIGVLLLYMSLVSGLFGIHWNWYLIPFNPLPLVVWLCWRKRSWYPRVYGLYAVVLVLFILATPLSSQLDLEHQLLTAALAVRCAARYLRAHRAQ